MPPKNVIAVVVSDELAKAVDDARGTQPRSAWVRWVIEQRLASPPPATTGLAAERQRRKAAPAKKATPLVETPSRVPGKTVASRSDVPLDRPWANPVPKSHQKTK